jgi:hypothetical protein
MKRRPTENRHVKGLRHLLGALAIAFAGSAPATIITIEGSHTTANNTVSDFMGAEGKNLTFGVDFSVKGPLSWQWSVPFDLSATIGSFGRVNPGQSYTPRLGLQPVNTPSIQVNQSLQFASTFEFDVFKSIPVLPDIDIHVEVAIPNVSFAGIDIVASGTRTLNNAFGGSAAQFLGAGAPNGYYSFGPVVEDDAWRLGGDMLRLLSGQGIAPAAAADLLGFDVNVFGGIDINRTDVWFLDDVRMRNVADVSVPASLAIGDVFPYTVTGELVFDLRLSSAFAYNGEIGLGFDGPFFRERTVDFDFPDYFVGVSGAWLQDLSIPFTYSGEATIGECSTLSPRCFLDFFDLPGKKFDPDQHLVRGLPRSSPFQTVRIEAIPEPVSSALLGLGLAGVIWVRRSGKHGLRRRPSRI